MSNALYFATEKDEIRYKVRNEACQSPVSEPGPVFHNPNMGVIFECVNGGSQGTGTARPHRKGNVRQSLLARADAMHLN